MSPPVSPSPGRTIRRDDRSAGFDAVMRTYPLRRDDGTIYAVEIENVYAGPWALAKVLRSLPEVGAVRVRRVFVESTDARVFFTFQGEPFVVWEPFGDNSRYWIGPEGDSDQDLVDLERAIASYKPSLVRRVIGDIMSLRFLPWASDG